MTKTKLIGARLGEIEYGEADVITFAHGLVGFPSLQNFLLAPHRENSPFSWLQSVDEPALAFLVANPWHFVPDYRPEVGDADVAELSLNETNHVVLSTAVVPKGEASLLTLNLAAPIVIQVDSKRGKQVVLEGDAYTIKHRVFPESVREAA